MTLDELIAMLTELRTDDLMGKYNIHLDGYLLDSNEGVEYDIAGSIDSTGVTWDHSSGTITLFIGKVDWMQIQ